MEFVPRVIRPMFVVITGIAATLIAANVGYSEKPIQPTAAPKPTTVAAEKAIVPKDVTSIMLIRKGGIGFIDRNPIVLDRTEKNANHVRRLAKALIDNGFLKLRDFYPGPDANPDGGGDGIEIRVVQGNQAKLVANYDYGTETDPTYLFEMLIRGAHADMKTRLGSP